MKQLLVEKPHLFVPKPILLLEGKKPIGGNMFVEGLLGTAEKINGNGRYYAKELWERETKKFQRGIDEGSTETCGELDHPDSQIINLKNISHAIRKIWWEGDKIMGVLEIFCDPGELGTSSGRIFGALIKNGLKVGVSSRGLGSLDESTEPAEVQDDFDLLTWDAVSNPSNKGSWMNVKNQLNENQQIRNPYSKVNTIITDILCNNGLCHLS
jgi:hypothetical protein